MREDYTSCLFFRQAPRLRCVVCGCHGVALCSTCVGLVEQRPEVAPLVEYCTTANVSLRYACSRLLDRGIGPPATPEEARDAVRRLKGGH